MTPYWKIDPEDDGVHVRCIRSIFFGRQKIVPPSDWRSISKNIPGIELLRYLVDEKEAQSINDFILIPHKIVASLPENQAVSIGLPPTIPYALQLRSRKTVDEPDFEILIQWLRYGTTPVRLSVTGAIASEGTRQHRIPGKLYRLLEVIEEYRMADTTSRGTRVEYWQPIQKALAEVTGETVDTDGYLDDLRIFHAASLSLSVDLGENSQINFSPVLFGRTLSRTNEERIFDYDLAIDSVNDEDNHVDDQLAINGVDTLVDEVDALLPKQLHDIFVQQRFDRDENCRDTYPLQRNTYLYIDPPLRKALDVVKLMQKSDNAQRKEFVKNPRSAFADALGEEANSDIVFRLFVETAQYADWVNGIGLWERKVLPWLPNSATSWLPEKIGFSICNQNVEIEPDKLDELRNACEIAISEGKATFDFHDLTEIPASSETLKVIDILHDAALRLSENDQSNGVDEVSEDHSAVYAVETEDNLEVLRFRLGLRSRDGQVKIAEVPPEQFILYERLLPHQRDGFDWLLKSWKIGRPGVLLADDMGLGKTIQALAFAAWIHVNDQIQTGGRRGPILIVAPTALLKNWKEEHDVHLANNGIGPIVELYGSSIREFKCQTNVRKDTVEGFAVLNREKLRRASCILTTYETLANYHISFAGIRYPLVIFDEIQKLKTPTTINTHAAKSLNIDFAIGLTGTPIENSLTELWSIMDRLHPGMLQDLRTFNDRFRADNFESLRALHDELNDSRVGSSAMLRRMKDTTDIGKALPKRTFKSLINEMPDDQARAYRETISKAQIERTQNPTPGLMLETLHRMRGISLHPEHPSTVLAKPERYDRYIARSARLSVAIEVLDQISRKHEKAMVFIEYREMQRVLADILRWRYGLPTLPPVINGQTPSARRQEIVSIFQQSPSDEFDVLILSPRAAGIGLNITSANHVIHLSRWWNPAVEDQCNDRAYRIGQDKPVTVYFPIARHPAIGDGSFDVKLDELLRRKRNLSRDLLIPSESTSDYREIFSQTVEL